MTNPTRPPDALAAHRTAPAAPPLVRTGYLTARKMLAYRQSASRSLATTALARLRLTLSILTSTSSITKTDRLETASMTGSRLLLITSTHLCSLLSCRILSTLALRKCPRQTPARISPVPSRHSLSTRTDLRPDWDRPPLMLVDGLLRLLLRSLLLLLLDPRRALPVSGHKALSLRPPARPQCSSRSIETPSRAHLLPI